MHVGCYICGMPVITVNSMTWHETDILEQKCQKEYEK